ncbi:MAG: sugar ABC transporter ATP-binding protein [Verrucomicrobia bacterium]|nr:sugar ABC transporter ATP-binding protein [Verrucomicrobiota bacterium]
MNKNPTPGSAPQHSSLDIGHWSLGPPLLEARRLTKRFPGVTALRDVAFELRAGEIHALCGENGAGKSTLIKLLSGIHPHGSYEGELHVDGHPVRFAGVRDAEAAGNADITQEFALVEELSVAENIFLGRAPRRGLPAFALRATARLRGTDGPSRRPGEGWRVDWLEMHRRAAGLLADFGLAVSPAAPVRKIGIGQKQLVEIIRAMDKKTRVLVLDEPTAALTGPEVAVLLEHLRRLRAQGTACIYISHKLDEVFAIADRITVLRDGASIATLAAREATVPLVIKQMVGRELGDLFPRRSGFTPDTADVGDKARPSAEAVLSVRHLHVAPAPGTEPFLRDISFDLGAGEVLGFGGLMGAGRTELVMHLFGAWGHRVRGDVTLQGQAHAAPTPRDSIRRGLVLATEDRRRYGLVLEQSIGFNLSLSSLRQFRRGVKLDLPAEQVRNQHFFESLQVKAPGQHARAGGLSGGNQQKVVLGKALMTEPAVVMLDEPTRGIDVGAKLEVYELINRLTDEGKAVILVSSELPELMGMSDRIIMLRGGQIGGEFTRGEATQEQLLHAALASAA